MNWKQQIEAQIAALWEIVPERADGNGFYDELHGNQANDIDNARQTMQALLDLAVASEKVVNEDDSYWNVTFDLNEPLDKLREVE